CFLFLCSGLFLLFPYTTLFRSYEDPYSDFGRLAMELWRAVRLVVDTGIHAKKWTREEGIDFYVSNTPNAEADARKMVERHIVMRSEEHTSELQSRENLVCRLLL